ncbi:MAG TPA: N-acetylmuramoyl-L-alanine amidase [Thermoanaerobaculia bacterium]|nr:N-acetylmuramoyl-L-alanine amidase [Thermoanaerobaculia bacterium]
MRDRRTAAAAALAFLLSSLSVPARAEDRATLLWKGESHPIGTVAGKGFSAGDAARALGFEVSVDSTTGVLTLTGHGHKVLVGAGTAQVPVDQRLVSISRPAETIAGTLFVPADFLEKVLFPLVGATGSYDPARRIWTLSEGGVLTIETAVVHVAPVTQVVFKQSAPAKFTSVPGASAVQIRWPGQTVVAPFSERRYEDPLVSVVRFSGDTATVEFRETGLVPRAYALTGPDRVVVEVARIGAAAGQAPPPAPAAEATLTFVIDPGHGGTETGAIGAGGLQEKQATLEIARKLAATLPRVLTCRVVLTRETDGLVSLDDRTSVANHEKADFFLSIHANSSRAAGARGSETYYLSLAASDKLAQEVASRENEAAAASPTPTGAPGNRDLDFILWDLAQTAHLKESSELAEAIQNELNGVSGTENRGIKQAPFKVLVGATMPAVLIETAFISNPDEEKKLASPEFQQSVADAIAKAVARFFALRRPGALRSPTPTPPR